ncbi:MAG: hypothetical protein ACXW13_00115 [Burkholderiaceae bacterium]
MIKRTAYVPGSYKEDDGQVDFIIDNGRGEIVRVAPVPGTRLRYTDPEYQRQVSRRARRAEKVLAKAREKS